MIITWTPNTTNFIDSFGSVIDWLGEYEKYTPPVVIGIYFKVGEYVYLDGCWTTRYLITAYAGDNKHYILNNTLRVSYTRLSRVPFKSLDMAEQMFNILDT